MKYDFLNLGDLQIPAKLTVRGEGARQVWVPVKACVIRNGTDVILYDLGCSEGERKGELPLRRKSDEYLAAQLLRLGIAMEDVTQIVVSHSHSDHYAGIELFEGSKIPVWVPKEDFDECGISYSDSRFHPVSIGEDLEISHGVRILTLPGHTKNLLGLLLTDGAEQTLIQSDAVYTPYHLEKPILYPEYTYDDTIYRQTAERLMNMKNRDGVNITFFHWPMTEGKLRASDE